MVSKRRIVIALVIVLVALIITIAGRRIRKKRSKFSIGNPAAPRQRAAALDLKIHLDALVNLTNSLQADVAAMGDAGKTILPGGLAIPGVVNATVAPLKTMSASLTREPPTYANLLGFHRGITGSDQHLLRTATAMENAGHTTHQRLELASAEGGLDNGEGAAPTVVDPDSDVYAAAGRAGQTLIDFGREIRGLLTSVHRLGASLDVE